MFELFIALFGGLYYGTKILGEKSAAKASDARFKRSSAILDTMDCSTDDEINTFYLLTKPDSRMEALNTIADELRYIFGNDWASKYEPQKEFSYKYISLFADDHTGNQWWAAVYILLAKQQKLRRRLRLHSIWGDAEHVNIQKRTFDMIEKCIQKYHPEYHIVIVPDNYGGSKGFVRWNFEL